MKIPIVKNSHLISETDFTAEEIYAVLRFAAKLKSDLKKGKRHEYLKGKVLAMIFEKNSTRTRVSFETGMFQLGGRAIFLSAGDIQISRGESFTDTAKVLSRYVNGIMLRTDSHQKAAELAAEADIPVINGLTDSFHPCQSFTDMFTIYERERTFSGIKLAYLGDGNNVANSLLLSSALVGLDIAVASPKGYLPDPKITAKARAIASISGSRITVTNSVEEAVKDAKYLYTDVWTSMGQEKEAAKRKKAFPAYSITEKTLGGAAQDCKVMHCLPAHRGEEISGSVMDSDRSIIFDQAENRLHVQKAILCALMK